MRDRMEQALRKSTADYTDIRIEDVTTSNLRFRGPDLDSIDSSRTVGGIVRALYRGGWGYATFNDLGNLEKRVLDACESARLVGRGVSQLAPIEPVVDIIPHEMERDFRTVPLAQKKALAEEYNRIILGHSKRIQTSDVDYGDKFRKIWLATSEGTYIEEETPTAYVQAIATARDGDNVQVAFTRNGGGQGYQVVEGQHERMAAAAQRAVDLLDAPPVTGGKYTVVVNPGMAGIFAHEAFGHLSEADFIYEDPHLQELMQIGKRFGPEFLNIIDDGSLPGQTGTHRYDFEGTPTRKNYLIKDGILVGRLHSRETAAKMKETVTGNARSISYLYPPIVRMTNTYIEKGSASFEDMIKDIQLGLFAVDAFGGQTAIEMFTFSAAYGFMIRNGQIAELVRDVTLAGNVFETLSNIDMLSDRVEWEAEGRGGCGKGNQNPLRVGTGGPYVRIQNVVVGGQQ